MKMKARVMVRAHQIARTLEGDYAARMSLALTQAWAETKDTDLGFREMMNKNGVMYFITNDIDGMEVYFLAEERSALNGKLVTRRKPVEFKKVVEKATGKVVRLFDTQIFRAKFEFRYHGKVQTLTLDRGRMMWA